VIDQTLSQIDTAIAFFEECLDRVRYDEAERTLLERLNNAISRFDMETKPMKQNTARDTYSRYN